MAKIKSRNSLFKGELVDKPKLALVVGHRPHPDGQPIYQCPHCGSQADVDECDCIGAEPGGLFCLKCNGEFQT